MINNDIGNRLFIIEQRLQVITNTVRVLTDILFEYLKSSNPEKFEGVMGNLSMEEDCD